MYATTFFGQVNLALMWLVVVDFLVLQKRRGYLTGLAIAIKLTPAVFLAIPFLRRDWPFLGRMLIGSLGATACAFVLQPINSWTYFSSVLWETDRIGDPGYTGNQSLKGLVTRLELPTSIWLFLVALVVLAGIMGTVWGSRGQSWHTCTSRELPDLALWAIVGLLCSPVSWTHHWVWALPLQIWALALLLAPNPHSSTEHFHLSPVIGAVIGISGIALAVFALPWVQLKEGNIIPLLVANSYVIWAGLGLVGLLLVLWKNIMPKLEP